MAVRCPVCEAPNVDDAAECMLCGKQLMSEAELEASIEPVPDVDRATFAAETARAQGEELIEGLEATLYAPARIAFEERLEVEDTRAMPAGEIAFEPLPQDFETGREFDDGLRTLPPEEGDTCPWCHAPTTGRICDNCGRRKARYTAERGAPAARDVEPGSLVVCRACFARVVPAVRCGECGVPMQPGSA